MEGFGISFEKIKSRKLNVSYCADSSQLFLSCVHAYKNANMQQNCQQNATKSANNLWDLLKILCILSTVLRIPDWLFWQVQLIIIFLQVRSLAIHCKMCLYCDVLPCHWELQHSCNVWGFVGSVMHSIPSAL